MRIYLSFNGVLHPDPQDPVQYNHKADLEAILRAHPWVNIVVCSSWPEAYSLKDLKAHFSWDVMGQIIDIMPPEAEGRERWEEILGHLWATDYTDHVVVLDADPEEFPEDWQPLLLCDPSRGFDREMQGKLKELLGLPIMAPNPPPLGAPQPWRS
jgi:hypothetical protein